MYHPVSDRYVSAQERYAVNRPMVSTNPHAPVERYTPQQQDLYYQYDRYPKFSPNDPYMRRDLAFQYRISVPYQQGHLVQVMTASSLHTFRSLIYFSIPAHTLQYGNSEPREMLSIPRLLPALQVQPVLEL